MPTEVLTVAQKKRAIERGLSHYLHSPMLERVLHYWEEEYSDKPSFVLNRFLSEICHDDELRAYRKDMLKQVLFELSSVEKQVLLNKPTEKPVEPQLNTHRKEDVVSVYISDAFSGFLRLVVKQVLPEDQYDFDRDVKEKLRCLGLAIEYSSRIHEPEFSEFLPITAQSKVITSVYETYCDFYGPSKADSLYANVKERIKYQFPNVDLQQLL